MFLDNNTQKNTKGGSPGIIDHLNEADTVKLDMGGRRVYVQEVVKHRLITSKHEVVCVVECTGGGYLFMTNNKMEAVYSAIVTPQCCVPTCSLYTGAIMLTP